MKRAALIAIALLLAACGSSQARTRHFSKAQVTHALMRLPDAHRDIVGLSFRSPKERSSDLSQYSNYGNCLVVVVLNTRAEISLYSDDPLALNPSHTAGAKVAAGVGAIESSCLNAARNALRTLR